MQQRSLLPLHKEPDLRSSSEGLIHGSLDACTSIHWIVQASLYCVSVFGNSVCIWSLSILLTCSLNVRMEETSESEAADKQAHQYLVDFPLLLLSLLIPFIILCLCRTSAMVQDSLIVQLFRVACSPGSRLTCCSEPLQIDGFRRGVCGCCLVTLPLPGLLLLSELGLCEATTFSYGTERRFASKVALCVQDHLPLDSWPTRIHQHTCRLFLRVRLYYSRLCLGMGLRYTRRFLFQLLLLLPLFLFYLLLHLKSSTTSPNLQFPTPSPNPT